jgi:hypothetical protein
MPSAPHVHIITSGENIHIAYPALFRTLPGITRTYVLAEEETYSISSDRAIETRRQGIRKAVDSVKELSATLSIPCSRELVFPPVYPSTRDLLEKIVQDNPGARFTMDLSVGSRSLCTALATMAPWLEAGVYSSFDEKIPRAVPQPDRPVRGLLSNPNHQTILAHLLRQYAKTVIPGTREWVSRDYLYKQVWSVYRRTRARPVKKPVDTESRPVFRKRVWREPQELAHGTFSDLMKTLADAGLVVEELSPGDNPRKGYRITERGEMAFRFYANPTTSSLVRTALGKKNGFQIVQKLPKTA